MFGKTTSEDLQTLNAKIFLEIFDGVPLVSISRAEFLDNYTIIDALSKTGFLSSNSEVRRALKENAISVNKEKVAEDFVLNESALLQNEFVLLQRGKKTYFILHVAK